MNISIIKQVVEQLKTMPQPMQSEVLKFAYTLADSKLQGTSGQNLLQFAGAIPVEDLKLMQEVIKQEVESVLANEQQSTSIQATNFLRPIGLCAGEFVVPDDFDAPLSEDILSAFEGK